MVSARLRIKPKNICWQVLSFIPGLSLAVVLLHTEKPFLLLFWFLSVCVCTFWCWGDVFEIKLAGGWKWEEKTTEPDLVKYYLEYVVQCKQSVTSSWTAMILMLRRLWETGANTVSLQALLAWHCAPCLGRCPRLPSANPASLKQTPTLASMNLSLHRC